MRAKNTQAISRSAAFVSISAAAVTAGMSRSDLGDRLGEVGDRFAQRVQLYAVIECLRLPRQIQRPPTEAALPTEHLT
jgi:hypothetical protein